MRIGSLAVVAVIAIAACGKKEEAQTNVDSAQAADVKPPATVLTQDTSATGHADQRPDSTPGESRATGKPGISGDTNKAVGAGSPSTSQKVPKKSP
jgi:hypothetical protein